MYLINLENMMMKDMITVETCRTVKGHNILRIRGVFVPKNRILHAQ